MAEQVLLVPRLLEAIAAARTEADYYRISLEILREATPLEVVALADSKAVPAGVFKVWLAKFRNMVMFRNPRTMRYRHTRLATGVSLYSSGPPEGKALIVGLCGGSEDLCAATPLILQYFADDRYDFVVLRDLKRRGFTTGILGYANSPAELSARLLQDLSASSYRAIRCFGVSAAGAAALVLGPLMGATVSVCIGGRAPTRSSTSGVTDEAAAMEAVLRGTPNSSRALVVYAAGHAEDAENARKLAELNTVSLFAVPDMTQHALVEPLDRRGKLGEFFRDVGLLD
jgi:hypothetical protein